jgi:glutamyl-tRNA synthetase
MLSSFVSSPLWDVPPKQRLSLLSGRQVKCRVAPSPTGHMHLGTARTALHNYLLAKATGGMFLLRIDDTDAARNHPDHVALIHRCMDLLGLAPDVVFHQSSRLARHHGAIQCLLDNGWATKDGAAVRLSAHARSLAPDRYFDLASGVCPISSTFIGHADNLVLLRQDNSPTYHMASVVDDIDASITLILRGMDHQPNVVKQMIIARALASCDYPGARNFCDSVVMAHVGLILKDGKKLAKRDTDSNLLHYFDSGASAAALLQWMMKLGWGHPDPNFDRSHRVMTLDQMPSLFLQGGLRSQNCALDTRRLQSYI